MVEICAAKGIRYVIISPGSRNAPLTITFSEHDAFECLSIPDERSAAFIALGIAQQTGVPAIITCTSGSASLNYAPGISEAHHQGIPMVVLTADRPEEWIGQGEGQSINQRNVYDNYILKSYSLHLDLSDKDHIWSNDRMVCEAIDIAKNKQGPVHINMPFREPLYVHHTYDDVPLPKVHTQEKLEYKLPDSLLEKLSNTCNTASKILILCGLIPRKNKTLNRQLNQLGQTVVVFSESTSNIIGEHIFNHIDGLLSHPSSENEQPEILITIGHSFISKKIKKWLRKNTPTEHWHISEKENAQDVFQALTSHIKIEPSLFFQEFIPKINSAKKEKNKYKELWNNIKKGNEKINILSRFDKEKILSDYTAFSKMLEALPQNTNLHLGNSSPVRYAQLFPLREDILYNSNRGVSGIDGSSSTAIGAALVNKRPTVLMTGDISFFYDSNALWNYQLPSNLRIIIINNQGGGIFNLIPGPPSTKHCETFFETHHNFKAKGICEAFHVPYFFVETIEELEKTLPEFYAPQKNNRPAVLEIYTDRSFNDIVYHSYFNEINTSKYVE